MKHKLSKRAVKAQDRRKSVSQWVPVTAKAGEHRPNRRGGKPVIGLAASRPQWEIDPGWQFFELGEGATNITKVMKFLDLPDYVQPVIDENGKLSRPKWEPIKNELGNSPDLGVVEANVQANETMPYNHYAREFIWSEKES